MGHNKKYKNESQDARRKDEHNNVHTHKKSRKDKVKDKNKDWE